MAAQEGRLPVAAGPRPHLEEFGLVVIHGRIGLDVVSLTPTIAADDGVQQVFLGLVQPARDTGRHLDHGVVEKQLRRESRFPRIVSAVTSRRRFIITGGFPDRHDSGTRHARDLEEAPAIGFHRVPPCRKGVHSGHPEPMRS
jgi:hypothetical protein